jgi:undecaprenyl-diphosphatase
MNSIEAIVIAIVEGLTEFLPVSSTGHMIITQALLGIESTPFVKAFTVIIQFGAILAVVVLYWQRFFRLKPVKIRDPEAVKGRSTWEKWGIYVKRFLDKFDFYLKLLIALVPAGVLGLLLDVHPIPTLCLYLWPVL